MEANLEGGEADGTFFIPGPGKRAILRKNVSFSTRRSPRMRPTAGACHSVSSDDQLDGDLYTVDSETDSLDELGGLESW